MKLLIGFVFAILFASFIASAQSSFYGTSNQGSARFTTYQSDFRDYYSSSQIRDYWPILGNDRQICEGRQDLLIQVAPLGCQPSVVRSDLLAEQNVPVFCQLDAIRLNPLLDIKQIRNIRFTGNYPKEISGVGFHPAQAALRTRSELLGNPVLNNIGYVVVVLKKQANETNLPKFVNVSLKAQVDYYAGNALGIGRNSFVLTPVSDDEWKAEKNKQSFFNGRYSVRLDDADSNKVRLTFYHGDFRASSISVSKTSSGNANNVIYLPGFYCQVGLKAIYDGLISSETSARLQIGDDVLTVIKGERFLNDKCNVLDIESNSSGDKSGKVELSCGNEKFNLQLTRASLGVGDKVFALDAEGKILIEKGELTISKVVKNGDGSVSYELNESDGKAYGMVGSTFVRSASDSKLSEAKYDNNTEAYFNNAIKSYRQVAEDFPAEHANNLSATYGEQSLARGIELAEEFGKYKTASELVSLYLSVYPDSDAARGYADRLNGYYRFDSSAASAVVDLDARTQTIRLLSINEPTKKSKATFNFNGVRNDIEVGMSGSLGLAGNYTLDYVDADQAKVTGYCREEDGKSKKESSVTLYLNKGVNEKSKSVCGQVLRLENTELEQFAKVRIEPVIKGPTIDTNLTVTIGIEQRALKLTPDKALERMENLNKTIKKWEKISTNLGDFVKGMKAACFATAGVLTVKNFVTGLSGEALARQQVMRGPDGWTEFCQGKINEGQYEGSITRCYNENAPAISRQVSEMTRVINEENAKIKGVEGQEGVKTSSTLLGESVVDGELAKGKYINQEFGNLNDENIVLSDGKVVQVSALTKDYDPSGNEKRYLSYQEAIELKRNLEFRKAMENDPVGKGLADAQLQRIAQSVTDRQESQSARDSWSGLSGTNVEIIKGKETTSYSYDGRTWGDLKSKINPSLGSGTLITPENVEDSTPVKVVGVVSDGGALVPYLAVLQDSGQNQYGAREYYKLKEQNGKFSIDSQKLGDLPGNAAQTIGVFKKVDRQSCYNKIENPEIKYYETEPYKGMPAVVPFDVESGWYVAARQTLAGFGNIKAYQSSGRPVSFWVCNVGKDHEADFFVSGFDDDICQQFNVETGAPLDKFSCLSESETRDIVNRASRALEDAARQRGDGKATSYAKIEGQTIKVGAPAVNLPGTQCQDFMSADDCKLLFNVCDPVICPSSRCNFGGKYPVADVIQSGIVGSALLCLPNIKEGVAIPVCLTGIKAGIDSYLSILKSHYACLQENVETGKYTGICDEISAVYMCEFFWRQAAPLANVLLPKLVETVYGQGQARGGGEYRTVQSAWDNAQGSVNYFTQSYAVNSLAAFNIRSVEEAGTPFCRAFISAKGPKSFESLIEPDSPSQFHAWFSAIPYSDATVPATSQYKVFYHVFAGNDQGVSYNVYLKDPPQTSYYQTSATVHVASGFAPRGQFATDSVDFTAPSGYQQLCVRVNDKEECGFKQVSTSFALNQIRDEFVNEEIKANDIKSESECVSGRTNPSALLTPNIQEIGQEAIDPAIYNRGVVRICATQNPGRTTDPARFLNVGFCGDRKVACWLDTQSVDNALTVNNVGLKNKTYTELQNQVMSDLKESGDYTFLSEKKTEIDDLGENLKIDKGGEGINADDGKKRLSALAGLKNSLVINADKAQVLFLEGKVYEAVAKKFRLMFRGGTEVIKPENPTTSATSADKGATDASTKSSFTIESFGGKGYLAIKKDGEFSHLMVSPANNNEKRIIYFIKSNAPQEPDAATTPIGTVGGDGIIKINLPAPDEVDISLNGAEIDFSKSAIEVAAPKTTSGSSTSSSATSLTFENPIEVLWGGLSRNMRYRYNLDGKTWQYNGGFEWALGWGDVASQNTLMYEAVPEIISSNLVKKDEMQGLEYLSQFNFGEDKLVSNFPSDVDKLLDNMNLIGRIGRTKSLKGDGIIYSVSKSVGSYDYVSTELILTLNSSNELKLGNLKVGKLNGDTISIDEKYLKSPLPQNIISKMQTPGFLIDLHGAKLYWGRLYKEASVAEEESSTASNQQPTSIALSLVVEGSKNKIYYKLDSNSPTQYTGLYWNDQEAGQPSNLRVFQEGNSFPVASFNYDYTSRYYTFTLIDLNKETSILEGLFKVKDFNGLKIKVNSEGAYIYEYPSFPSCSIWFSINSNNLKVVEGLLSDTDSLTLHVNHCDTYLDSGKILMNFVVAATGTSFPLNPIPLNDIGNSYSVDLSQTSPLLPTVGTLNARLFDGNDKVILETSFKILGSGESGKVVGIIIR